MKYYETMVIVHPALEKGHLKDNVVNVQDNIQKYGGDVITTEVWGKKRLAYYVEKQKYGTFTLFQYTGEKIKFNDFNVDLEHDTNILAYMTLRIDESGIHEQKEDLDSQIEGRSKVTTNSEMDEKGATELQKDQSSDTSEPLATTTDPKSEPATPGQVKSVEGDNKEESTKSEPLVQEDKE